MPGAATGGAAGEESILRYNNHCERRFLPMLSRFANPARFMRISGAALPWCAWAASRLLLIGLYLALIAAPPDYQQGEAVRIMYVHVPAAWLALNVYLFVAVASGVALVWRHPLAEIAARSARPDWCGLHFCLPDDRARCGAGRCGAPGGCGTRG